MSSGTISEKSKEQIQRKVEKCWSSAQTYCNYIILGIIKIFPQKVNLLVFCLLKPNSMQWANPEETVLETDRQSWIHRTLRQSSESNEVRNKQEKLYLKIVLYVF